MWHLNKIFIITTTVVILTLSLAVAGSKFPNKDTAKNRQDTVLSTQSEEEEPRIVIEKTEEGHTSIKTKSQKKEEVDWYDKIPIIVEPQVEVD